MLMPGAFPILDFDDDPDDLISPMMFADVQVEGPGVAVLAFLSEKTIETAEGWEVRRVGTVPFVTVEYPIYEATRSGQAVRVVPMPIGAAAAALVTERMIRSGAESLVAVGSCGALRKLPEGEFIVPSRALRDEGTSYHYLKAGAWVETDEALRATVAKVARSAGFGAQVAPVWTTDGFFRETRALVEQRKSQGCVAVEMECAAMAAIAKVRGVRFAQLLFTADTLADDDYDLRGFGVDSHHVALSLALEAAAGC